MVVEEVFVKSDSLTMVCSDKKNERGMRIQVSKSHYGEYNTAYLRLSAVEIIFKTKQEKEKWARKEEARKEKLRIKWLDKHGERHPQWGLPKTVEDARERINELRKKYQAKSQAQ